MDRVILHCDMDAFYASIEQRDHPEWRGLPVVVGGLGRRGVVSTASYEARKFGVRSAMPTAEARELAPNAIYVTPRMNVYFEASRQIFAIFERYTPLVESLSLDEAFLDVTASRDLFGDGEAIARSIQKEVYEATSLTVSAGVAPSKFVAKVASDLKKPRGITVVRAGEELQFLAPLPLFRLWGAGKVTVKNLEQMGMHTIGDLQRWTLADLTRALGAATAEHFYELSRGRDPREVEPERDAKSIGHETTFEYDITDNDACEQVLLELSESVGRRLRKDNARGFVVKLKLRYPPFITLSRQKKLDRAVDDDIIIYNTARELFRTTRTANEPVRLLGVSVGDLVSSDAARQTTIFEVQEKDRSHERLLKAVDAIKNKFGERAIARGKTKKKEL
ncbi:MAG: DNA polymerase IV [Planctomycetota bacterium]